MSHFIKDLARMSPVRIQIFAQKWIALSMQNILNMNVTPYFNSSMTVCQNHSSKNKNRKKPGDFKGKVHGLYPIIYENHDNYDLDNNDRIR